MRRNLEALLFATDQPLTIAKLAGFFPDVDKAAIRAAVGELRDEYDRGEHAFTIVEFGGGYSITTRPEHAQFVRKLFRGRRKVRLSKPALECLAIVAYKQPVTRLEVEDIRGVSVAGVLGTLVERELVHIVGRADTLGQPLLYGTTRRFLDYIGLAKLRELPQLSELEDLLNEKEELKQLAARYDQELTDEDFDAVARAERGEEPQLDVEAVTDDAAAENAEDAAPDSEQSEEPEAEVEVSASEDVEDDDSAEDLRAAAADGASA